LTAAYEVSALGGGMLLTDNIRLGRIKRYSLAEQAYRYLKDQILSGQIRQGDVITEQAIADQLHMSRTPVKNAISRLETENFVTTMNGRGTLVNVLSIADMRDIYSVRCALEELTLDTAVKNLPLRELKRQQELFRDAGTRYHADKKSVSAEEMFQLDSMFHTMFVDYTSNHYIKKLMPTLEERIQWRQLQAYILTDTFPESTEQHLAILDAMEKGNLEEAKGLLHDHLEWSFNVMMDAYLNGRKGNEGGV